MIKGGIIVNADYLENSKVFRTSQNVLGEPKEHDGIDELFNGFDPDKYYKKHDIPEMVDWGKPQGREIF